MYFWHCFFLLQCCFDYLVFVCYIDRGKSFSLSSIHFFDSIQLFVIVTVVITMQIIIEKSLVLVTESLAAILLS